MIPVDLHPPLAAAGTGGQPQKAGYRRANDAVLASNAHVVNE